MIATTHDQNRQQFAKVQAGLVSVEAARPQAENVERGKPENQDPENVVDLFARGDQQERRRQHSDKRVEGTSSASGRVSLPKAN